MYGMLMNFFCVGGMLGGGVSDFVVITKKQGTQYGVPCFNPKSGKVLFLFFVVLLFLFFLVNSLNLLASKLEISLEFLYLACNLVYEGVAFLARCGEEAEVVLVGLHFLLQYVVSTEQTGTLVVDGLLGAL